MAGPVYTDVLVQEIRRYIDGSSGFRIPDRDAAERLVEAGVQQKRQTIESAHPTTRRVNNELSVSCFTIGRHDFAMASALLAVPQSALTDLPPGVYALEP